MKIDSVELSNMKSYDDSRTTVELTDGVNAVIGENGAGKSTVQQAIGFALFDHLRVSSQGNFVRNGESSGWVRVTFVSNEDGHRYTVERHTGRSKHRVIDSETGELLDGLSSKSEWITWLKEHLGVPQNTNLDTVWKSSVGVPQNKFAEDFAKTPANRERVFDPLLDLDVYDSISSSSDPRPDLLEAKRELENELDKLERDIEELDEEVSELDELVETREELEGEIDAKHVSPLESPKQEANTPQNEWTSGLLPS